MHEAGVLVLGVQGELPRLQAGVVLHDVGVEGGGVLRQVEFYEGHAFLQPPEILFFQGRGVLDYGVVFPDGVEDLAVLFRRLEDEGHALQLGFLGKFRSQQAGGPLGGVGSLVVAQKKLGDAGVGLFPDGGGELMGDVPLVLVFLEGFQDRVVVGDDGLAVEEEGLQSGLLDPDAVEGHALRLPGKEAHGLRVVLLDVLDPGRVADLQIFAHDGVPLRAFAFDIQGIKGDPLDVLEAFLLRGGPQVKISPGPEGGEIGSLRGVNAPFRQESVAEIVVGDIEERGPLGGGEPDPGQSLA